MRNDFTPPPAESSEQQKAPQKEVILRTEKGAIRADIISADKTKRTMRVSWSHDGQGVGNVFEIDTSDIQIGKQLPMQISVDGGKTFRPHSTEKLASIGVWEKTTNPVALESLFKNTEKHSLSQSLPENEYPADGYSREQISAVEARYQQVQPEYDYVSQGIEYARQNNDSAKCNFAFGDPNTGWKSHLNIAPENVVAVSKYLKDNGYAHKYLLGGAGTEGKAFTIYFGAKSVMDKWASKLSADLQPVLAKPAEKDEVEVASGVVSRFTALDRDEETNPQFTQYGTYGLSARKAKILAMGNWRAIDTIAKKQELARDAFQALSVNYGSYFTG